MRKILMTFLIALCAIFSAQAQHGYRGFVDIGGGISLHDEICPAGVFTTTHGYQFNEHVFAGLGVGVELMDCVVNGPIYAQFRYDSSLTKIRSWYGLLKGGVDPFGYMVGPYAATEFGLRKSSLTSRIAWNFGLRFTLATESEWGELCEGIHLCVGIEF